MKKSVTATFFLLFAISFSVISQKIELVQGFEQRLSAKGHNKCKIVGSIDDKTFIIQGDRYTMDNYIILDKLYILDSMLNTVKSIDIPNKIDKLKLFCENGIQLKDKIYLIFSSDNKKQKRTKDLFLLEVDYKNNEISSNPILLCQIERESKDILLGEIGIKKSMNDNYFVVYSIMDKLERVVISKAPSRSFNEIRFMLFNSNLEKIGTYVENSGFYNNSNMIRNNFRIRNDGFLIYQYLYEKNQEINIFLKLVKPNVAGTPIIDSIFFNFISYLYLEFDKNQNLYVGGVKGLSDGSHKIFMFKYGQNNEKIFSKEVDFDINQILLNQDDFKAPDLRCFITDTLVNVKKFNIYPDLCPIKIIIDEVENSTLIFETKMTTSWITSAPFCAYRYGDLFIFRLDSNATKYKLDKIEKDSYERFGYFWIDQYKENYSLEIKSINNKILIFYNMIGNLTGESDLNLNDPGFNYNNIKTYYCIIDEKGNISTRGEIKLDDNLSLLINTVFSDLYNTLNGKLFCFGSDYTNITRVKPDRSKLIQIKLE